MSTTGQSFRHRDRGTDPDAWQALRAGLDEARPPVSGDHFVVVAAHPDDETLGAGGLLATAESIGARVTVVIATDGDASHPTSLTHTADALAAVRRRELYAALAELAPSAQVHLLGLPDGFVDHHAEALRAHLEPLIDDCTHVVTPWSHDRHPDHEACARVAAALLRATGRRGVQHWQYPIWAWHWATPSDAAFPVDSMRRLQLDTAAWDAKQRAITTYRSQIAALSDQPGDEPVLSPRTLGHFRGADEVFVVGHGPSALGVAEAAVPEYFDALYRQSSDPWGLDERFYEQRKRAAILAALTRPRFTRAFEPGCATGALTIELAKRCREIVAWDGAPAAVGKAQQRLAGLSNAQIESGRIPDEWPDGEFDLVLLSEVGYYCPDLSALVARIDASLTDDGILVACHWRHATELHAHTTGAVHAALGADRRMVVNHVEDDFLLQVWSRSGESVATAEGIVTKDPS